MMNWENLFVLGDGETPVAVTATEGVPAQEGAAEGPAQAQSSASGMSTIIMMLAIMVVMFFFMSRSNRKRQRQREDMLKQLTKGTLVATNSGMFGTIVEVREDSFMIEVAPKVIIEFSKAAVAVRRDAEDGQAKSNSLEDKK